MNKSKELNEILKTMDVPSMRMNDLSWLHRNLRIRNGVHPQFNKAITLIQAISKGED